jgi:hypothetical protein
MRADERIATAELCSDHELGYERNRTRFNRPQTDLYVVGVYNLVDDLDPCEAAVLSGIIERWWDRAILRFQTDHFWLLGAMDDLVLDSAVAEVVPLVPPDSS